MLAGRQLELTLDAPEGPVVVDGDARHLERLVLNLLSNAVKFTEDGGWVHCVLSERDGTALLEVSDNGIGIPEAEQHDLFTRFFRSSTATEHAIQGSGLGLAIVQSIARGHGGERLGAFLTPAGGDVHRRAAPGSPGGTPTEAGVARREPAMSRGEGP